MQKNCIWITGASGKLGKALMRRLKKNKLWKIIGTDMDVDVTDMAAVNQHAEIYKPSIIIDCASLSNAEYCESHMVEAFRVNALGARNLAAAARQHNAKILYISTDDVFSGEHARSKIEFDVPTPQTVYGKSKLAGESYVKELNPKHLIIRSSWVYGPDGGDYLEFVLDKARKGEPFKASLDKISTPTSSEALAAFIEVLLDKNEYGIYHASCEGACTRHEYARTILALAGYDPSLVEGTYNEQGGAVVSTLLDNLMMKMTGIYEMPQWQDELKKYIAKREDK